MVIVEKRLVLVEEIHVRKKAGSTVEEVPVILRSEEASVERGGSGRPAGEES